MQKKTLEKTIESAASDFAIAIIEAVKGASLQELLDLQGSPVARKPGRKPKAQKAAKVAVVKPKGKRLSKAEKTELYGNIVTHLQGNPGSSCKAVASALKVQSRKMGLYLKELRLAGKVQGEGNKAAMRYSAK